jgi:hypothetical protein
MARRSPQQAQLHYDRWTTGSECEVREALRLEYLRWARTYSEAVAQLSELTKEPIENEFFIQLGVTEKARIASGEALLAYDRHRNEHGCTIRAAA